jgi:hypothetical protein
MSEENEKSSDVASFENSEEATHECSIEDELEKLNTNIDSPFIEFE